MGDGKAGPETYAKMVEEIRKLDGLDDPTNKAMPDPAADPANSTDAAVDPAAAGAVDVSAVQKDLRALGHAVTVNGKVDDSTKAAVEKIQKLGKLPVDGKIDEPTADKARE